MAKSKLTKWIIGATGVAAFTGFMGIVSQADATKQTAASAPSTNVQSATIATETDSVKDQWLSLASYDDEEGEHGGYGGTSINGNNSTIVQPTQQTPTRKVRTRAS